MRLILYISFLICLTNITVAQTKNDNFIYWESLSQKKQQEILKDKNVLQFALDIYNGHHDFEQKDSLLLQLLDTITRSKNTHLFPFYYFVFIKICSVSDGWVSEEISGRCFDLLADKTEYVVNHIRTGQNGEAEMNYYIDYISYSLYVDNSENNPWQKEFDTFAKEAKTNVKNQKNKKILDKILNEVKTKANKLVQDDKQ